MCGLVGQTICASERFKQQLSIAMTTDEPKKKKKKLSKKKIIKLLKKQLAEQNEHLSSQQGMIDMTVAYMQEAQQKLQAQHREISRQHEAMTASVRYAQRIQQALIPDEAALQALFPDSFVFFRPCQLLSGDVLWCFDAGDVYYVAVVDCTGHGIPAAMLSVLAISLLRDAVKLGSPAEMIKRLDTRLHALTHNQSNFAVNDALDLALCCVDRQTHTLTFAGAHRPLYIVRNQELVELKGARYMMGSGDAERRMLITDQTWALSEGDQIYLFSDGYTDQFGGVEDAKTRPTKLTPARLKTFLPTLSGLPMAQQGQLLQQQWTSWKKHMQQTDDVLMVGLRFYAH
jgi:serine phosphatase RsbU (regulator of sigma subunit)